MGKVQFPLVNLRKDAVNKWHLEHISSEIISIPETPNQWGFYSVSLAEIPSDGSIADSFPPRIVGFTQYKGDPVNSKTGRINFTQNQFYVNYATGEMIFHPAQAGQNVSVDYYAKGSLIEAEDINYLYERVVEVEEAEFTPEFTGFEIANMPNSVEAGQRFPSGNTPVSVTFTWNIDRPELLRENSVYITMGSVRLASNIPTSLREYTIDISQQQRYESPFKLEFAVNATTLNGKKVSKSWNVEWVDRIYYGTSADKVPTFQKIKALPSKLFENSEPSQTVELEFPGLDNGYKIAAVPARYAVKNCKDVKTGLEFILGDPEEVSILNQYGVSIPYYAYFSNNSVSSPVKLKLELGA